MSDLVITSINKAGEKILEYNEKLETLLSSRKLTKSDLPSLARNLVAQAKLVKARSLTSDWPLENLQKELEGISYVMMNIKKKEMKLAGKRSEETRCILVIYIVFSFTQKDASEEIRCAKSCPTLNNGQVN